MTTNLILSRRFAPLFWCQFFSALNDNFVKNALVILILFEIGGEAGATLVTLAGAVLVAPFVVLSALGGELADRHDKAAVARKLKLAEIPVAGIAALGFLFGSLPLLFASLALFGVVAALFGPIKYGILPDHLETHELAKGNAWVEGATFIAILIGMIAGNLAADTLGPAVLAVAVMALAGLGWLSASKIPPTGRAAPQLVVTVNPLASTLRLVRELKADRRLWVGGLITSWFWLVGAVALSLLPVLMKNAVGGTPDVITLGLCVFTVGIAVGSALAARASRSRPNLALVPIGALLMGVFAIDLSFASGQFVAGPGSVGALAFMARADGVRILLDLAGLAVAGGLFIVPAFAAVQSWAPPERRARVIAACNVLSAIMMTGAGLAVAGLQALGAGLAPLFALLGAANLVAAVLVVRAWGREGVQDVARFVFRSLLGLEVRGLENLPAPGTRAIIAPNHVSFLDAAILHAILPAHTGFAIATEMAQKWWVRPFLRLVKAQAVDPTRPFGTRDLVQHVKGGEWLVIFPEGRLTVTGGLMKVYDGTAMIADKAGAVVVPVRIEGPERSPFGFMHARQTRKAWLPRTTVSILPPERLEIDEALKGKARRQAAGARLQDIMTDSAVRTARLDGTVFEAVVDARRTRDTGQPAVADPTGKALGYSGLIRAAQVLGRKLSIFAGEGETVGLMLPSSVGGVVAFLALQSIGRVPAMLNFTAGPVNVTSACHTAKVRVVITSRVLVERAKLGDLVAAIEATTGVVYLEDIAESVSMFDKVAGLRAGEVAQVARKPDDPAVILFTSGSEGAPKGVVLSHRNVLSNAAQSLARLPATGEDKVFNVLPMFHAFGLTAGIIMPLTGGVPVYLYPSPLHYRIVPELVYQTNATILFGTDTFLHGYARSAHPYDLARVKLVIAGAEAVKERTRSIYMEKFGVRILEGYGVTEAAPVLALNTPLANRTGTVGRLAPLMRARLELVPGVVEGGRLFVSGPNVMLGYLRAANPGVIEPPAAGWHDTGDIVSIYADGFISILGRAKRFAKIGGEMVSLAAVETLVAETWPDSQALVVAIPDERKGERLVVITTDAGQGRGALLTQARRRGMSELMVPGDIMAVQSLPLLGSGKPDYPAAVKLALENFRPMVAAE